MISIKPEKGCLLIAEPSIFTDTTFSRSVVLLAEHNENGSVGFVLNKVNAYKLTDFVPNIEKDFAVYNGGPVDSDQLYFIHRRPELITDSLEISPGVFWGGNFDKVVENINNDAISSSEIRFFLGYSGWNFNQLEDELRKNSWVVSENVYKSDIVSAVDEEFWRKQMIELGGDYVLWANSPENPNLN